MKKRISFTIDPKTDKELERYLKVTDYRNKSDIIERAIKRFLKEDKNE